MSDFQKRISQYYLEVKNSLSVTIVDWMWREKKKYHVVIVLICVIRGSKKIIRFWSDDYK